MTLPLERQAPEPRLNPNDLEAVPGSRPLFPSEVLIDEFSSERVRFELRVMLIVADMIFREFGAERMRILRILQGDACHQDGRAAEVSILEIPGMTTAKSPERHPCPKWIVERLNLLFPSTDGSKNSATLLHDSILLRVPAGGFPKMTCALGEWILWGATGRILRPHKIRI